MANYEDDIEVHVEGLEELGKTMDKIPLKFAQNIQRAALHAVGDVFAAEMEALAPVAPEASHPESEPGELRNSIGFVVRLGRDLNDSVAKIGPLYDKAKYSGNKRTHSPGVYGKFVEYGTRLMRARPFMRPAFEARKEQAVQVYAKVVGSLIHLLTDGGSQKQLEE
jgi:HK97 gp10 family phage protein